MNSSKRPLIALLAAPNTSAAVLYGLYDVLFATGAVYADMTIGAPGSELLDVRILSLDGQPFRCLGGVLVEPHAAARDLRAVDAVVVCDMYSPIFAPPLGEYDDVSIWLRTVHAGGALVASVCSGALVLAEAGLLDGREAAAHWAYAELFSRAYPTVRLRRDSILCLSSASDGIVTAGGVTAWQDLALYLIMHFCGSAQAVETAKVYLFSGHQDGQLPFAAMNRRINTSDREIAQSQEWLAQNYAIQNPVQAMAEQAGLSSRTFSRRFNAATGRSPIDYVQALRVEEAKQMLERESTAIDEIGLAVGYEDSGSFRRVFTREAGISPAAYRRRFQELLHTDQRRRATAH